MPKYIIAGCAGIDHIITREGVRLPPQLGGSGVYAAAGARIWSKDVGLVALINRSFPLDKIRLLTDAGIDTEGVVCSKKKLGLEGTIKYNTDGSRELGAAKGLMLSIQKNLPGLIDLMAKKIWPLVCPSVSQVPQTFLKGEYGLVAVMAHTRQAEFIRLFRSIFKTTILDPAPLFPGMKSSGIPEGIADLTGVNYALPSEQELLEYFGTVDEGMGASEFFKHGSGGVVLKKGSSGCVLFRNPHSVGEKLPVYTVQDPVDVTGAGDSFCGGFLVGLAETGDPRKASLYGAVSASFIIEGYGAQYSLSVTREEAEIRLKTL